MGEKTLQDTTDILESGITTGKKPLNNISFSGGLLVVNLRVMVNTRRPVRKTLEQLHLLYRFNATIVPDSDVFRGMLHLSKEHVAWCKLDQETAELLLSKRAERSNGNRITENDLKKIGYDSLFQLASELVSGKATLSGKSGIRQFFRLSPPRGGFKRSIRRQFSAGGILGPNSNLPSLVKAMV